MPSHHPVAGRRTTRRRTGVEDVRRVPPTASADTPAAGGTDHRSTGTWCEDRYRTGAWNRPGGGVEGDADGFGARDLGDRGFGDRAVRADGLGARGGPAVDTEGEEPGAGEDGASSDGAYDAVDGTTATSPREGSGGRTVWRLGAGAAMVIALIAVVLVIRALAAPAVTEVPVRAVSTAASAGRPAGIPAATPTARSSDTGDARATDPADDRQAGAGGDGSRGTTPGTTASTVQPTAQSTVQSSAQPTASGAGSDVVVVHVAGAVRAPGVVRLRSGSRLADAIAAAGGPLPGAQVDLVNLAALARDGTQIRVLGAGEAPSAAAGLAAGPAGAAASGEGSGSGAAGATGAAGTIDPGAGTTGTDPPASGTAAAVVNLNTADAAALDALPRVGPVLAQRIVSWRTEHGSFGSVDDLDAVPGIGEKMMEELRPLVSVR